MPVAVTTARDAENLDRAGGRRLRLLLDSASTEGRMSVMECELPAEAAGPPLHVHPQTDETFLVHEGTLLLHVAGVTHRLRGGDSAFVPRGTPHTFASADEPVRFGCVLTPGGFEGMHRDVRRGEEAAGRPFSPAEIVPIAARYDWQLAGPPLLPTGQLADAGRPAGAPQP